ncbi:serine kinase [Methylobacterium sp. Leaf465]|uniref:3-oxo-tetronate kinase n=1 Tax=Methylobacterium sp. Leaf465 TaxID=1736385 RepID=UPI000701AD9E|nr:3-oxo-tetronate kinase [Methylobacterium sp. Leaf465]KQT69356.1 serine kinase [Methylobacterium sp. Leaf465]
MSLALGSVADDYTGASDLANTLSKGGLRTVQTIGIPADDLDLAGVEAVVVALKSRSIPAAEAVVRTRAAEAWLRGRGAAHVLFKICSTFDSTDAGNIGPVLDALRGEAGEAIALVTPAFPETGRTVYQGNLFVGAMPLNESPLKDHPLNPMRDANLVRVLGRQSASPVGLVDFATVAKGPDAVAARLDALAAEGIGAAIADAVVEADLETLGTAALGQRVSVGASGLGLGLARALVATGRAAAPDSAADLGAPVGGLSACLAGSCSQATLGQITAAEALMPVRRLDPERMLVGEAETEAEIAAVLAWAGEHVGAGPVLIASSAEPETVRALQARHGGDRVGHALEDALARIAEGLVAHGVRRLVVAGGETSGAVVDRLGLKAFRLGPEIAAGVPVLRTMGQGEPMLLALKSGNFGGRDFFSRALDLMR